MGKKRTLNRMDYRGDYDEEGEAKQEEEAEEEEEEGEDEEEGEGEGEADEEAAGDDEEEVKPVKAKKKKAATTTKRTRTPKVVKMRAVWVVLDNSTKQIETFPYNERAQAEALVEQKNTDKKGFYMQLIKVPFDEKEPEKETKKK